MYHFRRLLIEARKFYIGFRPKRLAGMEYADYRYLMVAFFTTITGFLGHVLFSFLFLIINLPIMGLLNIGSVLLYISSFILIRKDKRQLAIIISFVEVILHAALAVMVVGWNAGFQYYLFCIIPVVLVSPRAKNSSKIVLTMFVAFGYWYAEQFSGLLSPSGQYIPVLELHAMNVFLAFFCIMIISFYIQFITSENERRMMNVNRMLCELADTDPLTGLMNRRSMQILLDSLYKNSKRDGLPLTILMMDLDRFKSVNDHYGHAAGDAVLVETATRLKHALRDNDAIARWGGEEFLVALPGVSLEQAAVVAEKLSVSVRNDAITIGGKPTWMTITIGIACISPEDTLQDLIERADTQLYKGKKSGRNCIVG